MEVLRRLVVALAENPEPGTRRGGCPCGQKATHVIRSVNGSGMLTEFWTCEEHKDASCFNNGHPRWRHEGTCPYGQHDGWDGPEGDPIWVDCPHRTHEQAI